MYIKHTLKDLGKHGKKERLYNMNMDMAMFNIGDGKLCEAVLIGGCISVVCLFFVTGIYFWVRRKREEEEREGGVV